LEKRRLGGEGRDCREIIISYGKAFREKSEIRNDLEKTGKLSAARKERERAQSSFSKYVDSKAMILQRGKRGLGIFAKESRSREKKIFAERKERE